MRGTGDPPDRRSGHVVAWNEAKIELAVRKAFLSLEANPAPAAPLAERVGTRARALASAYVSIETVQDMVQELVLGGYMRVAERYIVYRAERALLRARRDATCRVRPRPGDGEDLRHGSRSRRSASTWTRRRAAGEAELRRSIERGARARSCGGWW